MLNGCSSGDDTTTASTDAPSPSYVVTMPSMLEVEGSTFVAATTWSAAFVRAAGADKVSVLVPPGSPDPFGYVATEAELGPVADAEFVVVDGREALVGEITDALPTEGEIITFTLDNDPAHVKSWVLGLSERFMLGDVAQQWTERFDEALVEWEAELADHGPATPPTAIVDEALVSWSTLADLDVLATFDGAALTASEAADLAALDADLVLVASETPPPTELDLGPAEVVELTNFPDASLDLMTLFATNVATLGSALAAR